MTTRQGVPGEPGEPFLRVMTLNMLNDEASFPDRVVAMAEMVRGERPDVVCVQEVMRRDDEASTAAELAWLCDYAVVAEVSFGPLSGVGILSRLPVEHTAMLDLSVPRAEHPTGGRGAVAARLRSPSGQSFLFSSAHFAWGGDKERTRMSDAVAVDRWVEEISIPEDVVVLAGDLNTTPDADTVRWLCGKSVGYTERGTFWIDAWGAAGAGEDPGYTVVPGNPWAVETANTAGSLRPEWMPSRRVDYVLVRGWRYGRAGHPMRAWLSGNTSSERTVLPSDHYAVVADLWDPRAKQDD